MNFELVAEEEWGRILDDWTFITRIHGPARVIAAVEAIGASLTDFAQNGLGEFGYDVTDFANGYFRAIRVE